MTPRSFLLTPELGDYVRASSEPPDDVVRDLLAETARLGERGEAPPTFQIPPEQGALMQLLTRALGVRRAIEIGTFTGFSALCVARGLPADGRLVCLDTSEEWTAIARRYWERAGGAPPLHLRLRQPPPNHPAHPPPPPD
jgi:caffeoyl-CoA O-methyltransferase